MSSLARLPRTLTTQWPKSWPLLGGSQDLTYAAYKGYEQLNRIMNITSIDSRFDLENNDEITSRTWLQNIIMQNPNYLFFNSNLGYQTYFVGQDYIQLMDDLKFDAYRLGELQKDMTRAESLIRNADLLSVDIGAVRQSDAPGNRYPSPHGFYGEEFCLMMRYAGMSDKTDCLGLFEVNPKFDNHGQTAHMTAQGLWYFIEGFYNRKHDNPLLNPENSTNVLDAGLGNGLVAKVAAVPVYGEAALMKIKEALAPQLAAATAPFQDGACTRYDMPALLAVAAGYEFTPKLRAALEYHFFDDKNAKMANDRQKELTHGTHEILAGVEYDINEKFTVSCGGQRTDYGLSDGYQQDTSFACDSYSLGLGGAWNINEKVRLNVSYFCSLYSDYNKQAAFGQETYSRTNHVIGLGLDYKF